MGCTSSKRIQATVDVYRPPPTSFAVFDINTIQEPWLTVVDNDILTPHEENQANTHVPAPILEKLNKLENDAPHTWDEVSKALEDLKPTVYKEEEKIALASSKLAPKSELDSTTLSLKKQTPRKSFSFHTLEELEAKSTSKESKKPPQELRKIESMSGLKKVEFNKTETESKVIKPVKQNIFIVKDRLEREQQGKLAKLDRILSKRDPLSEYPDMCPPGGADTVVIYTTSLHGVRRTYEDCNRVRDVLELHRVVFDERDVSLHGEFLKELKELLGEEVSVPRVFVKGRYMGGVEEVTELNELGRLGRILTWARVERGVGRQACEGCGGARFVPCFVCGGSCKVLNGNKKERCGKCNENGLVHCPACI
ncbi:Glutaredoxin domain-containing protein [Cephalotus follicularis]|uniref:Glutaredoxin domain-containing protein n=1 Tax=Cephalotus follicularis TaxID=3775 RepID=A0A1Q3D8F3_CEPFO|nr:Glutaredoxin domain-containing protein [Cephalotus follicularis]